MSRANGITSETITSFLYEEVLSPTEKATILGLLDALSNLDLVNDLTTGGTNKAATAETVKTLKGIIDNLDIVSSTDIVNDLTTGGIAVPASAEQVKVLKGFIDAINSLLASDEVSLDELQEVVDFIQLNRSDLDALGIANIAGLQNALDAKAASTVIDDYTAPATGASAAAHAFDCAGKSGFRLPNNATNTTVTLSNISDMQRVTIAGNNTVAGNSVTIAHATYTVLGDQNVITNEATKTEFSIDIECVGSTLRVTQNVFG